MEILVLVIGLVLVLSCGAFVAAEFSLITVNRNDVEAGDTRSQGVLQAMENVSLMMAGAQLGITICSLALGALSEPAIAGLIEGPFAAMGVPEALLHPIAFAIALSLVTYLHVVFGEMVPKNIALAGPERMDMPSRQALTAMQGSGAHLARAVDENGVTLGILMLEDVLAELVGQIRDDNRSLTPHSATRRCAGHDRENGRARIRTSRRAGRRARRAGS